MRDVYEPVYQSFAQEVHLYSPKAAVILERIHEEYRAQIAFYAAYVILCLEMHSQNSGHRSSQDQTDLNFGAMQFFQITKEKPEARALFKEALQGYRIDCQRRFTAQTPH